MSLANVVYNASFGWEDRRWSLESQMEVPMTNEHPVEMGLKDNEAEVLARFEIDRAMENGFVRRSPARNAPVNCRISSGRSPRSSECWSRRLGFRSYLYQDDHRGMSARRKRGVALFFSDKLRCSECHGSVNISGPTMFTGAMPSDPEAFFHDTGVAATPPNSAPRRFAISR